MVYYGALSKGCQRCRRRKIRCDQRKPGCVKCEKSNLQCLGYRNLTDIRFRDESNRIVGNAQRVYQESNALLSTKSASFCITPRDFHTASVPTSSPNSDISLPAAISIPRPLCHPVSELGANFFFAKYVFNERPFSNDYLTWLQVAYTKTEGPVCAAIDAVGLAGNSNVSYSPEITAASQRRYCGALASMKDALTNPVEATMDTTLITISLLGLFETVNFDAWDRYSDWAAHVQAATTLLELRGQEQFSRQRGGQLFVQIRSQILLACTQQYLPVPPALVRTTYDFETSLLRQKWRDSNIASPGSISEISFRIVNLRAACANGEVTDPLFIRETGQEIDADLQAWRAVVPRSWEYTFQSHSTSKQYRKVDCACCFEVQRHIYPTLWIAEVWNNWRVLRILINQIIVQTLLHSNEQPSKAHNELSAALTTIQDLSMDICMSVFGFKGTPRTYYLLPPHPINDNQSSIFPD